MSDPNPKPNKVTTRVSGLVTEVDVEVNHFEELPPDELKAHNERKRKYREQFAALRDAANPASPADPPSDDKPAA